MIMTFWVETGLDDKDEVSLVKKKKKKKKRNKIMRRKFSMCAVELGWIR